MFGQTLPRRPYACDDVHRPRITTIRRAIERRYIQLNEPWRRVWIVADVDRPGAAVAWEDADIAPPNWTAVNRVNGHCHNGWLLQIPVLMGDHDRAAPMRYLDAVEGCMSERIGADPGYAGLLAKNPLHDHWQVLRGPNYAYTLDALADWLPDIEKWKKPPADRLTGIGRNVDTFDTVRLWAYKRVVERKRDGVIRTEWIDELVTVAAAYTGEAHKTPLGFNEVRHLAHSIGKWTWKYFRVDWLRDIQRARGKRSGKARRENNAVRDQIIGQWYAQGLKQQEIADRLGVCQKTVSNVLVTNRIR